MEAWGQSLRDLLAENLPTLATAVGRIALVLAAAWVVGFVLQRIVGGTLSRLEGRSPFFTPARTDELRRLTRALIRLGIGITVAVAALDAFGLTASDILRDPTLRGYLDAVLVIIAAHVVIRVGVLLIDEVFERAETRAEVDPRFDAQRAVTLKGLLR
ncbi:MAG TPA: hypothetical protein VF282_08350, partial [Bacillota bacterium]